MIHWTQLRMEREGDLLIMRGAAESIAIPIGQLDRFVDFVCASDDTTGPGLPEGGSE